MSRKLTSVDFARIWGLVSKLSQKQWEQLAELRHEQVVDKVIENRKPRKAKPTAEVKP